jgi:long-chain acyl-CoA synthetase
MNEIKTPWLESYGEVPFHIDYPEGSMSAAVFDTAKKYPQYNALSFMGKHTTYEKLTQQIDVAARAFAAMGIKEGDRVTICMPNVPQTVMCFYGLNRIGAIPTMIHPLSSETEIAFYLRNSGSVCAVTLDQFRTKFKQVERHIEIPKLLITSVADALSGVLKVGYKLTEGRKIEKVERMPNVVMWKEFIAMGESYTGDCVRLRRAEDPAVILFSGGTSGTTKGILLSNLNFNALALQTATMGHCQLCGKSMLAAMPMFHGFGLGVCIHTMLVVGGRAILVPRFDVKKYAQLLDKEQPNYIAGVPTLYEAITRNPYMKDVSLACLMGVFSGGDSLSIELKKKLDKFLADHGATVRVREGYGTTECVTASCLTPYNIEREGSIGLPFPDTYYKICAVGTTREVDYGTEGEICLCGPSVMMEYINNPKETADTLKLHDDGRVWLHTGDLGYMDEEGFIYFRQRIKRMIITSGYNVYPSQVENIIDAHEAVQMSCVIGVRDEYKMQRVKAFVVLLPGYKDTSELRKSLREHCEKHIAKYALPYEIEIREALPKTLVGKVAYTVLEKEEAQKSA